MRPLLWAIIVFLVALASVPISPARAAESVATACVTCLGPQTNTLWKGYVPLGGFTHYGRPLIKSLRPEVLFIDTDDEIGSPGEALLWPLVKALDAFGSWTGVQPANQGCATGDLCYIPTFNLSHAVFRSRYVALTTAYIAHGGQCNQRLPAEVVNFLRHEHWTFGPSIYFAGTCWKPPHNDYGLTPLLLIGGYLQAGPQVVTDNDLMGAGPSGGQVKALPFSAVHDALSRNAPTSEVSKGTLYDVNAEANLIEAFLCHADGREPRSACGRAVIKTLLKRIR